MHYKTLVYLYPTYATLKKHNITFKNVIIILFFIFLNMYLKLILKSGRKSNKKTLREKLTKCK